MLTREQLIKARDALAMCKSVPPKGVTTCDTTFRIEFTGENIDTISTLINKALEEPIEGLADAVDLGRAKYQQDSQGIRTRYMALYEAARRQLNQGEMK